MENSGSKSGISENTVRCTFRNCTAKFADVNDMKRHKSSDDDHEYCIQCDLDFPDWDSHVIHRVESSAHITCICGLDFRSLGGLERHQAQAHPVNQDIECPYCLQHFTRAANYVKHVEQGRCPKNLNSKIQMEANKQHKFIVKKILAKPEDFNFNTDSRPAAIVSDLETSEGGDDTETSSNTGGVDLFSVCDEDEEQMRLTHKTLLPDPGDLIDLKATIPKKKAWPSPSEAVVQEHQPARAATEEVDESEVKLARDLESNFAWELALAAKDQAFKQSNSANLMHSHNVRIINPQSESYDPSRFWDPNLEAFRCPYSHCDIEFNQNFTSAAELQEHMIKSHTITRIRCPACFKIFGTSASMVAHAETPIANCKLHRARNFGQLVDEITGGFLNILPKDGKYDTPLFKGVKPPKGFS
ncbi:MAG: hypothetical protein M1821_000214 [Bathelium mastoideum]|nr:MAG: hypothetical protein M1821_000214 [Bathelium mastoideum]KAI9687749.1 MAG: hypothetical protein M1822_001829 [Bathelium mastoideum]